MPAAARREMRIGVDFDNTIADYDEVFLLAAKRGSLVSPDFSGGKEAVRAAVRLLENGEEKWMSLQGKVYGALMSHARIVEGFADFIAASRKAGVSVCVVSHKTERGHFDKERVDLREAARRWMQHTGLFSQGGHPDVPAFFESTRLEKIERIKAVGCSHFIDDLEEVFLEPTFPQGVGRYLLSRRDGPLPAGPFNAYRNWNEISDAIFA